MKTILLLLCCLFFRFSANAQCEERFEDELSDTFILHKDLVYGSNISSVGEEVTLLVDIFEPAVSSEIARPLVILIHGGSFFGGNKEVGEVVWLCEDFARRGIVTASISYRLEPDILSLTAPEKMIKAVMRAAEDTKAAIRYFHKSIAEGNPYLIDENLILVGGASAGSIAALHAVFMDDFNEIPEQYKQWVFDLGIDEDLIGNSGNTGYSSKVAGVINISGALKTPDFMENNVNIPLLNIHNEVDFTIPYHWGHPYQLPILPQVAGSYPLHQKMKSLGGYSDLYTVPEINHVPYTLPNGMKNYPVYFKTIDRIAKFLRHVVSCTDLPTAVLDNISEKISIYPNPASTIVKLEGINQHKFSFELFQIDGQQLPFEFNSTNNQIDLSKLSKGSYILKGTNWEYNTYFTKQIIVQ
jgi:para-nitrobenzyl esterase